MTRTLMNAAIVVCLFGSISAAQSPQPTATFKISGMTCGACAKTIESVGKKIAGVSAVTVDYPKGVARVTFDAEKTSTDQIAKLLTRRSITRGNRRTPRTAIDCLPFVSRNRDLPRPTPSLNGSPTRDIRVYR